MIKEFTKGIVKENPVLVLALGLCPALATSTTAYNGIGMGIAASFVLVMSNIIVSAIKKTVPSRIRIPIFITVIATFVTIVKLVMAGYTPGLSKQLGIFIPLIVVNCIILGRAEAFASKNGILKSALDGLGMGLGFAIVLFVVGSIREILGSGTITLGFPMLFGPVNVSVFGSGYNPALLMILPPGGFLTLGLFMWLKQLVMKENG
ncbi:electron transport complex subunit RsxE [bacterium]|nr:MAG: electron transport complex subunit RsxE [bacterium]